MSLIVCRRNSATNGWASYFCGNNKGFRWSFTRCNAVPLPDAEAVSLALITASPDFHVWVEKP